MEDMKEREEHSIPIIGRIKSLNREIIINM
jgi:hypothetical protein